MRKEKTVLKGLVPLLPRSSNSDGELLYLPKRLNLLLKRWSMRRLYASSVAGLEKLELNLATPVPALSGPLGTGNIFRNGCKAGDADCLALRSGTLSCATCGRRSRSPL